MPIGRSEVGLGVDSPVTHSIMCPCSRLVGPTNQKVVWFDGASGRDRGDGTFLCMNLVGLPTKDIMLKKKKLPGLRSSIHER